MKDQNASHGPGAPESIPLDERHAEANHAGGASIPDRRQLIKKLGQAAVLPMVTASFVATDATDARAY